MLSDPTLVLHAVSSHTNSFTCETLIYRFNPRASVFWGVGGGGSSVRWTDDRRFAVFVRMSEDDPVVLSLVLVWLIRLSGPVFSFKNHPVLARFFLVDALYRDSLIDVLTSNCLLDHVGFHVFLCSGKSFVRRPCDECFVEAAVTCGRWNTL